MRTSRFTAAFLAAAVGSIINVSGVSAAAVTGWNFTTTAGSYNWDDATKWDNGAPETTTPTTTIRFFNDGTTNLNPDSASNWTLTNNIGNFSLSQLTLGGQLPSSGTTRDVLINNGANTLAIANGGAITIAADRSTSNGRDLGYTIDKLTMAGDFTINGSGTSQRTMQTSASVFTGTGSRTITFDYGRTFIFGGGSGSDFAFLGASDQTWGGSGTGVLQFNGAFTLTGNRTFNTPINITLGGNVTGTAGVDTITKQGTGTLRFNGTVMSAGDIIDLQAGSVALNSASTAATLKFNGANTTAQFTSAANYNTPIDFTTAGKLYAGAIGGGDSNVRWQGVFTGTGDITVERGQHRMHLAVHADSTWTGTLIAGTGGRGAVVVENSNLNANLVRVTGRTGQDFLLHAAESTDTGWLRLDTPSWTIGGLESSGVDANAKVTAWSTNDTGIARVLTIDTASGTRTYSGALSDVAAGGGSTRAATLAIIKTGSGTQEIVGNLFTTDYSGGTTINGGTLLITGGGGEVQVSGSNAASGISNNNTRDFTITDPLSQGLYVGKQLLSIDGGATLSNVFITKITGNTVTIRNQSGSGITLATGSHDLDFGATSSTGTGNVTVNDTGTLAGNGYVIGSVLVNDGGTLSPGNSIGAVTVGALTLASGAILDLELGTAGEAYSSQGLADFISVSGALVANGIVNIELSDNADADGKGSLGIGAYQFLSYSTADLTGVIWNITGPTGYAYAVDTTQSQALWLIVSEETPIPEPASLALLGLGAAGLLIRRRRQ